MSTERTVNQGFSREDLRHYEAELRTIRSDLRHMQDFAAYGTIGKLTNIVATLIGQLAAILPDPERDRLAEGRENGVYPDAERLKRLEERFEQHIMDHSEI